MSPRRVVIIGGGLAGMAAAETLSRLAPMWELTLLESKRHLGGRAGSHRDTGSGADVDYCQHVAMGCCTNFIDLMQRCELDQCFNRYSELTFLHPDHPPSRFAPHPWLPAPLHLGRTVDALRYLDRRQKREIKRGLWKLMRCHPDALVDLSASRWLETAGQSEDTVRDYWDVILVSALGERTDRVSMSAARKVIVDGFAAARGASDVLVPAEPLSRLFSHRLAEVLRKRGVKISPGARAKSVSPKRLVKTDDQTYQADAVVCAVAWHQIDRLFSGWTDEERRGLPNFDVISKIPASPITGIHLWFDRPLTSLRHAVLVGTQAQWLFRDPCGTDSQSDALAADRTGGAEYYHQVVISASADQTSAGRERLLETVQSELRHAFPEAREARLLRHRLVTDPNSVFSVSPKTESVRPSSATGLPWLALAGDWTQTGWPATMEGAVISGRLAAKSVLESDPDTPAAMKNTLQPPLRPGRLARWIIRGLGPASG